MTKIAVDVLISKVQNKDNFVYYTSNGGKIFKRVQIVVLPEKDTSENFSFMYQENTSYGP